MKLRADEMTRGEFKEKMKAEMKERGAEGRAGFFFEAALYRSEEQASSITGIELDCGSVGIRIAVGGVPEDVAGLALEVLGARISDSIAREIRATGKALRLVAAAHAGFADEPEERDELIASVMEQLREARPEAVQTLMTRTERAEGDDAAQV